MPFHYKLKKSIKQTLAQRRAIKKIRTRALFAARKEEAIKYAKEKGEYERKRKMMSLRARRDLIPSIYRAVESYSKKRIANQRMNNIPKIKKRRKKSSNNNSNQMSFGSEYYY